MTPSETLILGAIAILFVVAWFVFGLIDATRPDKRTQQTHRLEQPAHTAPHHQGATRSR